MSPDKRQGDAAIRARMTRRIVRGSLTLMANVAQPGARAKRSGREVRTGPLLAPSVVPLICLGRRAARGHAVVLAPPLQPARSDHPLCRVRQLFLPADRSVAARRAVEHSGAGRSACWSPRSSSAACSRCCSTRNSTAARSARLLVIAPFFVMPTVSALIWKNLLMHPVNGLFAFITRSLRSRRHRLVRRLAADLDRHHRRLAVAAVRDPHPAHRAPVARPRAGGGGAHGRRQPVVDVLLHHPAAPRAARSPS